MTELADIARHERHAAAETVERLLSASARVSVYLYQPMDAPGLRECSPGVLWDVGPLPDGLAINPSREQLYQCAQAGRTGSFLQSAEECTRRVPQTTRIDSAAFRSYRAFNQDDDVRMAQIAVEQCRHGFRSRAPDGPPTGAFIHHLALSPSVQSFASLSSARLPVLGTIFTVTAEETPLDLHEYSNLVDYAIFIAGELLEIRAEHLLGRGHVSSVFEGSALEALLDAPTSDLAVQLIIKLIFAHHWFFPYDPVAYSVLMALCGDGAEAQALYRQHGWCPPRTGEPAEAGNTVALRDVLVGDLTTLIGHICWYRTGRDFHPPHNAVHGAVSAALATALPLLCGKATQLEYVSQRRAGGRGIDPGWVLARPAPLTAMRDEAILMPVFPWSGLQQLARHHRDAGNVGERFEQSFSVCGPGDTGGVTRTHLKPMRFIEGFGASGSPRFSARMPDNVRAQTRWICSYAIARLASSIAAGTVAASGRA